MRRLTTALFAAAVPVTAVLTFAVAPAAAAGADTLASGASLRNNQQIAASNNYRFTMGSDGNAVVRNPSGSAVWTSGTQGHPGAVLTMQTDGNLVIRATNGVAIWANGKRASNPHLTIQTDGNLVERSGSGAAVWATGTPKPKPPAQPGPSGATLPSNGKMTSNQALRTSNGYTFTVQSDGNLVQRAGSRVYRTFGGPGHPSPSLVLQTDGNLVARTGAGVAYWATNTAGRGAVRLLLGNDGNLVLYTAGGAAVWQSGKDTGTGGGGTPPGTPPGNPGDTKNCGDFPSQAAAQAYYEYYYPYYGDIAKLDGNNDGTACESYDY